MMKNLYILFALITVAQVSIASQDIDETVKEIEDCRIDSPENIPQDLLRLCYRQSSEQLDPRIIKAANTKLIEACTEFPESLLEHIVSLKDESLKALLKLLFKDVITSSGIFETAHPFLSPYLLKAEKEVGRNAYNFVIDDQLYTKPEHIPESLWVLGKVMVSILEEYKFNPQRILDFCQDYLGQQLGLVNFMLSFVVDNDFNNLDFYDFQDKYFRFEGEEGSLQRRLNELSGQRLAYNMLCSEYSIIRNDRHYDTVDQYMEKQYPSTLRKEIAGLYIRAINDTLSEMEKQMLHWVPFKKEEIQVYASGNTAFEADLHPDQYAAITEAAINRLQKLSNEGLNKTMDLTKS